MAAAPSQSHLRLTKKRERVPRVGKTIGMNLKQLPKLALAALFAATTATAVVGHEAANPAATGADANALAGTALAADAQGDPYYHRGWHHYHGRYWAHRRWHAGYYGPYHHWHPGFWVYF